MIAAALLLFSGAGALARETCAPVETAPGIKSIPAGCNKFGKSPDAPKNTAKPAPSAKPSALFPGSTPGSITKFGDTEVRIGGQVRYEFGAGR